MKRIVASLFALTAAGSGCGDDSVAADTGMADTGDAGSALETTACTFPVTVTTPSDRVFMCNADSATACELTTAAPPSAEMCTDMGSPDWTFIIGPETNTLDATGWMITGFDVGAVSAGGSILMEIPDVTPVTCIIIKDGIDYDLAFSFDIAAKSVTVSNFAVR